ncbi:squalene synthase HpnC [Alicyclobacillus sacchari]|uniref:Squalene synthase HpnC n=1 Tax=Alicyclobacillus sacchari TaxID=392010 RepID=A0A4R8LX38_9BACL|nr:squalene synthase HpnC [Alicyclobacillus sacchari]TDY51377.1 squalene synthase HpnC [Alicyclobacillus sacchari]
MQSVPVGLRADFEMCARLTASHYENFSVVSLFVPRGLRPHFCSIYAFCRGVDDLGDELEGDRLAALDAYEEELRRAYGGTPQTPVFRALQHTIEVCGLPIEPFLRLIEANRRDQRQATYETWDDLRDYCRYSADPVGRLVLGVFGCCDEERATLSDYTCTALQVANHLQDIHRDLQNGRIYLPKADLESFGASLEDIRAARMTDGVRACIKYEVERTADWFRQGARLEALVPRRLAMQLRLYRLGGEAVLAALHRQNYDPFVRRPVITSGQKLHIAMRTLIGVGQRGVAPG